jgi:glycosyltransferase involved in cell wall biosynthesis
MWRGQSVAVILPTYNEKDSIRASTLDFFATGLADEVIVVNNNAAPGTSRELVGTGAREIFEAKQGYGHALLCGIDHCKADLVVLAEPDGTFSGHDLLKFLAYSDDVPVVFGTRTTREFIWTGANMGRFLRWGNWAVAKMTEVLFGTSILTDMGCTYRLFRRAALERIRPHLAIGGSHFGRELPQQGRSFVRHWRSVEGMEAWIAHDRAGSRLPFLRIFGAQNCVGPDREGPANDFFTHLKSGYFK